MVTFIEGIAFILLDQKKKLKSQEKLRKNKDFCGTVMPSENDNILIFGQYMKSD